MTSPKSGNSTSLLQSGPADINLGLLASELTIFVKLLQSTQSSTSSETDRQSLIKLYLRANKHLQYLDSRRFRLPRPTVFPSIVRAPDNPSSFRPLWRHWRDIHVDRTCSWCLEHIADECSAIPLECLHLVCRCCLQARVEAATKFEFHYPATCCEELDVPAYAAFLDEEVVGKYADSGREYKIPVKARLHCARKTCGRLLVDLSSPEGKEMGRVWCEKCRETTCTRCKRACSGVLGGWHFCPASSSSPSSSLSNNALPPSSSSLPSASISSAFDSHRPTRPCSSELAFTPRFRIKPCPSCSVPLELSSACNHMTCRACNHEFCFVCLQSWKLVHPHRHPLCPVYNDPAYDEEGFSIDEMGIHWRTGRDREGFDLGGLDEDGRNRGSGRERCWRF